MPDTTHPAIRTALLDDFDLVTAGLLAMLRPFTERVQVLALRDRPLEDANVDVVLHDPTATIRGVHLGARSLRRRTHAKILAFSWDADPHAVQREIADGADGFLSKSATAAEVVEAVERVHRGEKVLPHVDVPPPEQAWLGQHHGLTAREGQVLGLIASGMSNLEIAGACYLSINSVKTYIRTAYRKLGVTRRADAVRWAIEHDATAHLDAGGPRRE